ncbi:MAG: hypothetical protein KKB30_01065 [Proteobacteria bacterium]|nr:hypothetical protein [Pseudomonadota bacterium]MBU1715402.1 hypothetical protein [Pseudomonadota bacterium]
MINMIPFSYNHSSNTLTTIQSLALHLVAFLLLTGCSSINTIFYAQNSTGLPLVDSNTLSRLAENSRAKADSAQLEFIPRKARPALDKANIPPPTLSLKGYALKDPSLIINLYTDKIDYSTGYTEINQDRWQIIAFDNIGRADSTFEFIYILTSPEGEVQYLVINGGKFRTSEGNFIGFEGTLIKPGTGNNLENPAQITKIDFGYNFPRPPVYQTLSDEAKNLAKQIEKMTGIIQSNYMESSKMEADLSQLRSATLTTGHEEKHQQNIIQLKNKIAELTDIITRQAKETRAQFEIYFGLRQKISNEFAAFSTSNQFFWENGKEKQKHQNAFRRIIDEDLKIEATLKVFGVYVGDNTTLLEKQQKTRDVIAQNKDYEEKF